MSKEVELLKKKDIEKYIQFVKKVFEYDTTFESVEKLLKKSKVLIIKDNEQIISSLILEERYEHIKCQNYYYISYLGVLKEYRRFGYATKLFNKLNELVKENNIKYLELMSGNQRRAAHFFYKSQGFKLKDTTVFIKLY